MKVRPLVIVAVLVAAVALPASSALARGSAPQLQLHRTKVGTILVNARGFTLYAFTKDTRDHDACAGITACLSLWPAVTTSGSVSAGRGVKRSLIGTIKFRGSQRQITYAGHPLYTYAEDTKPAQTSNINILQFDGRWPALSASGKLIT
jgi:predicted lipoprotein with Yx(FWY)xxD motif